MVINSSDFREVRNWTNISKGQLLGVFGGGVWRKKIQKFGDVGLRHGDPCVSTHEGRKRGLKGTKISFAYSWKGNHFQSKSLET